MRERILLMGPPGAGKSEQLLNVASYLESDGIPMYILDLEDKLEAMILNRDESFSNTEIYTAFSWDEPVSGNSGGITQITKAITEKTKPGDWIGIDRVDLAWPMVQRWFTQQKYNENLAERMLEKSKQMTKSSMFIPRFDQGSWQVINEQYEEFILKILYKSRCNILLTTGIKGIDDNNPSDIGRLGVLPRGQKEIGHQPHSLFLLYQRKVGKSNSWRITTDKDLKKREYFESEEIMDFAIQYLSLYYHPEKEG